jgi:hypothetical protein
LRKRVTASLPPVKQRLEEGEGSEDEDQILEDKEEEDEGKYSGDISDDDSYADKDYTPPKAAEEEEDVYAFKD